MVTPVSGPFHKTVTIPNVTPYWYYYVQEKYKQVKPYDLKLPYYVATVITRVGNYGASNNFNAYYISRTLKSPVISPYDSVYASVRADAQNKAISRFNDDRGSQAAVGVSMAECRESVGMITKRIESTFKAARALKKLRFGEAFRHLGLQDVSPQSVVRQRPKSRRKAQIYFLKTPRKVGKSRVTHKVALTRSGSHAFAENWLELSFGWLPMVGDVYSAMEVLSDGPSYYVSPVRGSASSETSYDALYESVNYSSKVTHKLRHSVIVAADISILNPNKDLSRRMGLANPFAILWELVPFSFVVDYFYNVGDWLEQFNQDYGVTVYNASYTHKLSDLTVGNNKYRPNASAPWQDAFVDSEAVSVERTVGSLPSVILGRKPKYHLGIGRALNNVSLLVKLFTKER